MGKVTSRGIVVSYRHVPSMWEQEFLHQFMVEGVTSRGMAYPWFSMLLEVSVGREVG